MMTPALDYNQARFNMVEQQIRTWDVLDQGVLDLLFKVKREDFVPAAYRSLAFCDIEIPLPGGEHMMTPKIEARLVQELAIQPHDRVLEIGTGSGYVTALLASRSRHVTSVEIHADVSNTARVRLAGAGIADVTLVVGDGAGAQPAVIGPDAYDVIAITGSTPVLPPAFQAALKPGARLFAVVGDAPVMTAVLLTKLPTGGATRTELFETVLAPLVNAEQPARFEF